MYPGGAGTRNCLALGGQQKGGSAGPPWLAKHAVQAAMAAAIRCRVKVSTMNTVTFGLFTSSDFSRLTICGYCTRS